MKIMTYSFLILALSACQKKHQQNPVLQQANQEHLDAIRIHSEIKDLLKLSQTNSTDSRQNQLDSLNELIQLWEESAIEVPGFAHTTNDEHHHHEHKPAPAMTDESMLAYQQNAKKAILELKAGLESVLKEIPSK